MNDEWMDVLMMLVRLEAYYMEYVGTRGYSK